MLFHLKLERNRVKLARRGNFVLALPKNILIGILNQDPRFLVIIPCQLALTMETIESADPARNFKLILVGRKEIQCEEWNKQFAKYKNVSGIYRQYSCFRVRNLSSIEFDLGSVNLFYLISN